jgi:hypothetical protein
LFLQNSYRKQFICGHLSALFTQLTLTGWLSVLEVLWQTCKIFLTLAPLTQHVCKNKGIGNK